MFNVILADPCWSYNNKNTGGSMKSGSINKYPTMSLENICDLNVSKITEPDCILFLWITNPLIFSHAPKVLSSWGFTYKTMLTWEKTGCLGMGFWLRGQTEHLIIATKGHISPFRSSRKNIIHSKRLKHSEKPEEVKSLIDEVTNKVFGTEARKLEMFARKQTNGWDSWGLNVDGKTIEQKINEYCPQNIQTGLIMNEVKESCLND